MLYLLIALCSHSQLVRLRGDSLPGIEEGLRDLLAGSARPAGLALGQGACSPPAAPTPGRPPSSR